MPPIRLPSATGDTYVTQGEASFLSEETTRRDMTLVMIIVDINRLKDESWGMLNDLLLVIAFSGPHLRTGYDDSTLLHFTEQTFLQGPTDGMTGYDKALLRTLYTLPEGYNRSDAVNWMANHFSAEARSR